MAGFKIVLGALQPLIDRITMPDGRQMPRIWGLEDFDDFDKRERFPWGQLKDLMETDADLAGAPRQNDMSLPQLRKAIDTRLSWIESRKDHPAFQDLIIPALRQIEVLKKQLAERTSKKKVE
jgi:hypothetical protein